MSPVDRRALGSTVPRILVVDDNEAVARVEARQLVQLGFRTTWFCSAVLALEAFRRDPDGFSVVVTDQTMPELSGLDLARELRALRPDLPIVMVTGDRGGAPLAYAAGIDRVLFKPASAEQLDAAIRAFVG